MGKSRRGNREFTREQKLLNENKKLKRENAQLRKQVARMDLDRFDSAKELIEEHYQEDMVSGQEILDNLKKTWACKECSDGHLEIFTYNKVGKVWYYRICSNAPTCRNRTTAQPYSPNVKGIIRKPPNE